MTKEDEAKVDRPAVWLGPTVDPLAALAAEPTCAAAQADGVPCDDLGHGCDCCLAFFEHRDRMRAREGPW